MTFLRRHRFAMLTAAVGFAGAAFSSTAHAALRTPDTISPVGVTAAVGVNASGENGDLVVGWMSDSGFQARFRPAGGPWEAVAQLSAPTNRTYLPDFTVDPDGAVTAIWSENTPSGGMFPMPGPNTVFTARRPAGGNWETPEALSTPDTGGNNPQVALLPDSGVVAVWTETGALKYATRSATGAWDAPQAIPSATTNETPSLTADGAGNLTVAYESSTNRVMATTLPAGGAWSAPVQVSSTTGSGLQRLVTTKDGDATLVWFDMGNSDLWASRRSTVNGSWTTETLVSGSAGLAGTIAADEDGNATAAWPAGGDMLVSTRDASGTWSAPASVGASATQYPAIATDPDGTVTLAWQSPGGGVNPVRYATRVAGGAWSAAADVTGLTNGFVGMSVDGAGDPVISSATGVVTVVGSDNSGPQLRNLSIPATAAAGAPVNFSVSPLDTWSALGTTTWDFGDGAVATGTSVSHQFATAGSKTVTVKSTDAFNHETSKTETITVTGGTPPTPEPPTTDGPPAPPTPPTPTDPAKPSDPAAPEGPCVSRRVVKLSIKVPAGQKVRRITLAVTGQKTRTLNRSARSATVDMRGVTRHSVTAKVKVLTKSGKVTTDTRTYRTCGR